MDVHGLMNFALTVIMQTVFLYKHLNNVAAHKHALGLRLPHVRMRTKVVPGLVGQVYLQDLSGHQQDLLVHQQDRSGHQQEVLVVRWEDLLRWEDLFREVDLEAVQAARRSSSLRVRIQTDARLEILGTAQTHVKQPPTRLLVIG